MDKLEAHQVARQLAPDSHLVAQLCVGDGALVARLADPVVRDLVAEAARDIGIDEIGDGVVRPALQERFKRWRQAARMNANMGAASTYECGLV